MSWVLIAICAPLLWALSNHIDKYLLSRYSSDDEVDVGGLIVYSSLFPVFIVPIIFLIQPHVLSVSLHDLIVLVIAGTLNVFAVLFYLYAMEKDEASAVMPFLQLVPVFGYFLGYFVLGEILTSKQILGCLVILVGAIILSIEFNVESKTRIKKGIVSLMVGSAMLYAVYDTLFKVAALKEDFWASVFWEQTGMIFAGILFLVFIKSYRESFSGLLEKHTKKFFFLNVANEGVYAVGAVIYNYSLLLAPIALVMLINVYQPVFVFIGGVLLTLFFPKIATEKIKGRHLWQKISALLFILAGSFILYI